MSIVSAIVLFGNKNTIIVFISKNIQLQNTLYIITLGGTFVASLVVMIVFFRIDVGFVLVAYVFNSLALGELLGKKSFSFHSKNVLLQKFLVVILGVSFFYIFGVDGILYAIGLSYSSYLILVFKSLNRTPLNFPLLKQHIGFVSNNYSVGLLQITKSQIDKLIIPVIISFSILGHYALAIQILTAMNLFSNIIFKFILPYDASGEPNTKIKFLTIIISIIIAISGIIFTPIVLPLLFPAYIDAILAIQIMSITVIPTSITFIFTSQFLGMEKSRYVMLSKFFSMMIISVGMIILGSLYGMQGLAISYLVANSADAISLVILNQYEKNKSRHS